MPASRRWHAMASHQTVRSYSQGSRYPLGVFGSRSELATTRRIRGGSEGRKNVGAKIGLEAVGGRSSVQCATERQNGGLGPAGTTLSYDQGECFRNRPVPVPGLLCGRRWGRLQSGLVVWATHLQTAICACPQFPPARDRARIGPKYYGNEGTKESGGCDC